MILVKSLAFLIVPLELLRRGEVDRDRQGGDREAPLIIAGANCPSLSLASHPVLSAKKHSGGAKLITGLFRMTRKLSQPNTTSYSPFSASITALLSLALVDTSSVESSLEESLADPLEDSSLVLSSVRVLSASWELSRISTLESSLLVFAGTFSLLPRASTLTWGLVDVPSSLIVKVEVAPALVVRVEVASSLGLIGDVLSPIGVIGDVPSSLEVIVEVPSSQGAMTEAPSSQWVMGEVPSSLGVLQVISSSQGVIRDISASLAVILGVAPSLLVTADVFPSLVVRVDFSSSLGVTLKATPSLPLLLEVPPLLGMTMCACVWRPTNSFLLLGVLIGALFLGLLIGSSLLEVPCGASLLGVLLGASLLGVPMGISSTAGSPPDTSAHGVLPAG